MRLVRRSRHLIEVLRSRGASAWRDCDEPLRILWMRFWSGLRTSDHVKQWFLQVTAAVAATTLLDVLAWLLRRGH